MKLEGAVINFLGDSITQACGASCEEKGYVAVLEKQFGLKKANNYGIGGTRFAKQTTPSIFEVFDLDFCQRMEEMDESADAVVVFGGTNDFGHGDAPLGVPTDRTPDTFWGACHYLMDNLLTRYPGKPIVFITPLHRFNENDPKGDGKKFSVAPLSVYRDIIMEVAQYYAIPVLDLYATSGMQPSNEACRNLLMPDGLHPSDAGHAILARKIGNYLLKL
ncbi:MAG: SGNH/GDSL hydrolase family protein [Clostridiales bacterium]|nr:SGNH/GDSL hydrolase family protein [Clostridiales bacterium]